MSSALMLLYIMFSYFANETSLKLKIFVLWGNKNGLMYNHVWNLLLPWLWPLTAEVEVQTYYSALVLVEGCGGSVGLCIVLVLAVA